MTQTQVAQAERVSAGRTGLGSRTAADTDFHAPSHGKTVGSFSGGFSGEEPEDRPVSVARANGGNVKDRQPAEGKAER
ncbi:hypothetical protein [Escherichia coli]|uniref:hypothetical protein n=1 Tax=Escherichia coli TaxID=562 RepID=UPI00406A8B3C